jgi:hypothetical protein
MTIDKEEILKELRTRLKEKLTASTLFVNLNFC